MSAASCPILANRAGGRKGGQIWIDTVPTGWYVLVMENRSSPPKPTARDRLLDAALRIIREKGYAATTVDDLCAAAGVTKGAFFHHFKNKDELGAAAARHWTDTTVPFFQFSPYHAPEKALDRVLATGFTSAGPRYLRPLRKAG